MYFILKITKVETMIQSMTGFANAVFNFRDTTYQIELKSLNSKTNDINYRSCSLFRGLEIQAKTILTQKLQRGKIDLDRLSLDHPEIDMEKYREEPSSYQRVTIKIK